MIATALDTHGQGFSFPVTVFVTWAAAGLTNMAITAAAPHIVNLFICSSFPAFTITAQDARVAAGRFGIIAGTPATLIAAAATHETLGPGPPRHAPCT